jgi:peptide/nickel transport system permease protein
MAARRLVSGMATLFVCSVLIFLACNLLPGDVALAVLGKNATPERVAQVEHALGLDQSFLSRYLDWIGGLFSGDLGQSSAALVQGSDPSISSQFLPALANSMTLAAVTLIVLVPVAMTLGIFAGSHEGKVGDHATSAGALLLGSLPEFVLGAVMILVFFQWLGWLPPVSLLPPGDSALSHPDILVLPVLTLLGVSVAGAARQIRAGVIETRKQDYVTLAQLNGLPRPTVALRYTLRNATAPAVQVIAQTAQYLIGGIIIVEGVFNYPGVGQYLINAVTVRDVPVIQTVAVVLAAIFILINVVADLVVVALVPALRTGR